MNGLLNTIYTSSTVEDAQGNKINPFPTSIPFETGAILYHFLRQHTLHNTIEIGMAYGLSTLFLCQAHQDNGGGHHIAIDPVQQSTWQSIGLLNVEKAGLTSFLQFYNRSSFETLPQLAAQGNRFDFAFIDGRHHFDFALVDFFYIDLMLEVGSYIAFDDLWMPALRKLISYIVTNRAYEVVPLPTVSKDEYDRSSLKQTPHTIGHFLRNLVQGNAPFRVPNTKVCILKKTGDDERTWNFHHTF